jgi:hypothetical protein
VAKELAVSSVGCATLGRILPGIMGGHGGDHSSLGNSVRARLALLKDAHRDLFSVSWEGQSAKLK